MKFSLKSSFTNIRKEIQAIFGNLKINSFDDSKYGVSKTGLEENVFIKDVPTVKEKCNSEMNNEFAMILNTLNDKMLNKFTMCDFDLSDISKYQHLIVSGSYQTTYDFEQKNATQSPSNLPKGIWEGLVAKYRILFGIL